MSAFKRLAFGVVIAALAIAPWALLLAYAWANNTLVYLWGNSTNWSDLVQILIPPTLGGALVLGFCFVEKRTRPYVRGWRIVPASWIIALGGMFWVGFSTMGF